MDQRIVPELGWDTILGSIAHEVARSIGNVGCSLSCVCRADGVSGAGPLTSFGDGFEFMAIIVINLFVSSPLCWI